VNAAAATYDMDLVREDLLPELRAFVEKAFLAGPAGVPPPEVMVLVGESASEIVANTYNRAQIERAEQQIQEFVSEVGTPAPIETVVIVGSPAEGIAQFRCRARRRAHRHGPSTSGAHVRTVARINRVSCAGIGASQVLALPPGHADVEWLRASPRP
jgi:hypothetical protein